MLLMCVTVDHSVKQYIVESLPAVLENSGNLVLWKVVTLILGGLKI